MRSLLAVFGGGLLGTGLRLLLDALAGVEWATLAVNVVGAFALGLAVSRLWPVLPVWAKAGLGPGVLGSFTTFSAVAVGVVTLEGPWALVFVAANVILGIAAAFLGLWLGRRPTAPIDPVNE